MNTILQQRIEKAAKNLPLEDCYSSYEDGYIRGATEILNNLWISVEEALPEEDIPNCFVTYKTLDMVFYSTGSYEKDNDEWYVDSVGFNVKVTHWMPIPKLNSNE